MPWKRKKPVKLSDLDAEILKILLKDGRAGYDEIAEKCEVTRNVAWKHCRAMEKKGIIKGATVQINYSHFGFEALATLLISVGAQQLEQVMELVKGLTEMRAYRQYNSVYNVRVFAALRNLNALDQVKQIIKQKVPTIGLKTYFLTGVRNIPENLNLTGFRDHVDNYNHPDLEEVISTPQTGTTIDELDNQIVKKLTLEGRASFTQIAKQIGVSTDTVAKRYNKLRKQRSIKVSIQIDPTIIGYSSMLDFNIAFAAPGKFSNSIIEMLSKIPDMIIITRTLGDYELQGTAMIRDISELFAIQDQIAGISGVTKIEASAIKIPDRWPAPQQHISTF
ncbi:MAG: Lrp/AsnC family transcriptional regulator [Candidatus Bathyarchaeota archaeon]|nr:Lrp/AsnC family transcriptional regulator [Candidatus Bathyarchaeota archaeon]